jgi:hypothetical protein
VPTTDNEPEGGWTPARVLLMIVGVLGMGGFGICSLCGLVLGASQSGLWGTVLMFTVPGAILTWLFFLLVRKIYRATRKPPP